MCLCSFVTLATASIASSELKHPNLSHGYNYALGLLACQDDLSIASFNHNH